MSRRSRAVTVTITKCTKNRAARAKIQTYCFLDVLVTVAVVTSYSPC